MNEVLKDKLRMIADDEYLLKAIEVVFDERIRKELPEVQDVEDNQKLGERYRAYNQAEKILKAVIVDISGYSSKKVGSEKNNRGK